MSIQATSARAADSPVAAALVPAPVLPPSHEIHVTLFGQPCLLNGPVSEATLKAIHSVSPEQISPDPAYTAATSGQIRRGLEQLQKTPELPHALDRYRTKLGQRLDAQIALMQALDAAKRAHKSDALAAVARKNFRSGASARLPEFDTLAKRYSAKAEADLPGKLFDIYNEGIEPDPEEEFHRGIQALGIRYSCAFEESGGGGKTD